ncbi:hypothetical protein EJV47_01150 [Hymenobacter gummosus]|uniref:Uncharacterized protein n=1 Tax=Hymenobacter gummosus TaxID=1776032 RepID=A0A3S0QKX3_9BACT|nr:hypothetical protein [Hymenobacter gummosus]RTQ53378.1 hypothetical protein EJV47_01150 [Hymenobacter gummosus]
MLPLFLRSIRVNAVAVLLLASTGAVGQTTTPPPLPPLSAARYSVEDTIRAIRHLFGQRSKGARGYTAAGSATLTEAALTTALRPAGTAPGQRIDDNQDYLAGGLMLGYGLARGRRFGPQQREQLIAAYTQGEPLPPYVRRRLKPRHFLYRPL